MTRLLAALVALGLVVPATATAKVTAEYKLQDKSLRVTVHTSKKLRSDEKLRVYLAQPCGGRGHDIRPAPGKPRRITLRWSCKDPAVVSPNVKGPSYLGVDLLRDGHKARNVVTKRIAIARARARP